MSVNDVPCMHLPFCLKAYLLACLPASPTYRLSYRTAFTPGVRDMLHARHIWVKATPYVCLLPALNTLSSADTASWLPCLYGLCISGQVVQL